MRVLAFDTATAATVAAVVDHDAGIAVEARDDPGPGSRPAHAARLLELVEEALERAGGGWAAIDRIAVGVGPGTFTGLRIGVATAQGLASARDRPLVPVSTLASLARGAAGPATTARLVALAVIDARRGEAFVGRDGSGPAVVDPIALGTLAAGCLAVGDGAIRFRQVLEAGGASVPEDTSTVHRVSAIRHCELAIGLDPVPAHRIQPDYLRVPDAELNL